MFLLIWIFTEIPAALLPLHQKAGKTSFYFNAAVKTVEKGKSDTLQYLK